jgi:hypothetical protein
MREGLGRHARRRMAHQVVFRQVEQLGVLALGLLAPMVEGGAVVDAFGNERS